MTSNNLKYKMDFHAEANSQTKRKFNLLPANKISVQHMQKIWPNFWHFASGINSNIHSCI